MSTAPDSTLKFYRSRQSAGVWTAIIILIGVISVGASIGMHSVLLTSCLLFGEIALWCVGYWLLSKNLYYVSSTKAGFKDMFRSREVQFADVRSAMIQTGRDYRYLDFQCADASVVRMPLDVMDESWLSEVKAELSKRGIVVSKTAFGIPTTA